MIANILTNQWKRLAFEITWTPYRSWIMTFFGSFLGPSMVVDENQLEVIAALPKTKHGRLSTLNLRSWLLCGDQAWRSLMANSRSLLRYSRPSMAIDESQLEVAITLQGPSMMITESQLEAITASSRTKYGNFWWPIRGRYEFYRDQAWPPLTVKSWSSFEAPKSMQRDELSCDRYGRESTQRAWRLVFCVSFCRSHRFTFQGHMVPREVARWFGSGAFNAWATRLSSLGYVTLRIIEIATVGLNFWKGF